MSQSLYAHNYVVWADIMPEVPEVGAFLLGVPKCGTTWLAEVLTQHPAICVSDPKEPNIVASHKGTFGRDDSARLDRICELLRWRWVED